MLLVLSLSKNRADRLSATHTVDRVRDRIRLWYEPMSNGDYREKDGGARLEEIWHVSMEGSAELESVMNAIGPRSA